jgi:hypothetical protein
MNIKISEHSTLAHCPDCNSEHIAPNPCGLTWLQRMRTSRLDTRWMPNPPKRRLYYDDEAMKETFGQDRKERREQYLEETKGGGAIRRGERIDKKRVDTILGPDPKVDE